MNELLYVEINVMGIMILFLIESNIRQRRKYRMDYGERLFEQLVIANIIVLVFDTGTWCFADKGGMTFYLLNQIFSVGYFIMNPVCCLFWLNYNDFTLFQDKNRLKKRQPFYMIPPAINAVLTVLSPWTGWIFYIDDHNHYTRGSIFLAMPILSFLCVGFAYYITIRNTHLRNDYQRRSIYRYMIMFPLVPLAGSFVQCFFFGLPLIWEFVALSLLFVFMNVLNGQIYTDTLTGVYNRQFIDYFFHDLSKSCEGSRELFALLIDVDDFKRINDSYGHLIGDQALIQLAAVLEQRAKKHNDIIVRLGGDEFMVFGTRKQKEQIDKESGIIQGRLEEFNLKKKLPFPIHVSIGCGEWGACESHTVNELIRMADTSMYDQKRLRESC